MYKIIFTGKEDSGFFVEREADSYETLLITINELCQYSAIKGKIPTTMGESFISYDLGNSRKFIIMWSKV